MEMSHRTTCTVIRCLPFEPSSAAKPPGGILGVPVTNRGAARRLVHRADSAPEAGDHRAALGKVALHEHVALPVVDVNLGAAAEHCLELSGVEPRASHHRQRQNLLKAAPNARALTLDAPDHDPSGPELHELLPVRRGDIDRWA